MMVSPPSLQAQISGAACPISVGVVDHLMKVGEGLMKTEVQIYEQGVSISR